LNAKEAMQIGYIGLGKMGKNMVLQLLEKGHQVVAWNRSPEPRQEVQTAGATTVETIEEMVSQLNSPRIIWLMLPAKEVTNQMIAKLASLLSKDDILIDGGNSHYIDTVQNAEQLAPTGIRFLDVGTSGGPAGARAGACLMIGGNPEAYQIVRPLFADIASPDAYRFFPGYGAGHFVKMIHNGIEYGMMQAIAEGFAVLKESPYKIDLVQAAQIYNNRSVIESRLVGWLESGYDKRGVELEEISGTVAHSGEGQWTVDAAEELGVKVPIIKASLQFRIESEKNPSYTGKVVSLLRNEFGGHQVEEKK
jgi:6-phosphogluconate dehydrogenase